MWWVKKRVQSIVNNKEECVDTEGVYVRKNKGAVLIWWVWRSESPVSKIRGK